MLPCPPSQSGRVSIDAEGEDRPPSPGLWESGKRAAFSKPLLVGASFPQPFSPPISHAANQNPKAFRLMALERMKNCESVSALAEELGIHRRSLKEPPMSKRIVSKLFYVRVHLKKQRQA